MTELQKILGGIGAMVCAAAGFSMTDSGSGAVAGGIAGFALGAMIPNMAALVKALLVVGAALGIAILIFKSRLPALPESGGLHLTNTCGKLIDIYLWWRAEDGGWTGNGPWSFNPNSSTVVSFTGGERLVMTSGTIYYYAASRDGAAIWMGDNSRQIGGRTYNMRQLNTGRSENGNYRLTMTCEN